MKFKKLLYTYNAFQFFFSLLLWVPIFYEYQKRIGLTDTEIFRIQSLYYLIFCLIEIPTGYLADWFGYKLCLKLGSVFLIIANLLIPFAPSYSGFLIHFILLALARSFVSGASSAYLYETLRNENRIEEYKDAEGKARAYSLIGKVICWAGIGLIMQWHFTLPYWLTALNSSIGLILVFFLPDIKITKEKIRVSIKELFSVLIHNPYLILLMFQGVALFVMARICQVNLFQPILHNKGFSVASYGIVMSIMTVFEAGGSYSSKWVQKYINDLYAIFIFTFIIGISFIILSMSSYYALNIKIVTIFSLCLFSYVIGISFPIQRQLINQAIPDSRMRASLLSCESIIDRAVNSLVAGFLGASLAAGHLLLFIKNSALTAITSVFLIALLIKFVGKSKTDPVYK